MFWQKLHLKLGDLWWYTILLFLAQRFVDVINLFVGLWLVPKYVPQDELGAVMPLTQVVSFLGLPLSIVAIPFMKFLGVFAERGEPGKVKALLRDVFVGSGIMVFATLLLAWLVLPFVFDRMRVAVGSLGVLVVLVTILGSVSVIFQNAAQGLKLFSSVVWFSALGAPFRLLLTVIAMPFRALSGCFVGQMGSPTVTIVGSIWALRHHLRPAVKAESYWKEDGPAILRYTWPIALNVLATVMFASLDQLIIRHRLPAFDSAGYYVVSRFAEISNYIGSAFVVFLFPLVAGTSGRARDARRALSHSVLGTYLGGGGVALLLLIGGHWLLGLTETWRVYQSLSFDMFLVSIYNVLAVANLCFMTYEMALGRFRFLWCLVPLYTAKAVLLFTLTGYRLSFIFAVFIVVQLLLLPCLLLEVFGRRETPSDTAA